MPAYTRSAESSNPQTTGGQSGQSELAVTLRMWCALITFDGAVGIRTRANGISIGAADVDTIQEVQILTANYSAEFGRSAAGQIRMITKSGGEDFHGTL